MIKTLTLTGKLAERVSFGKVKERTFTFQPGVNVLVGSNGSGKSTILEVLKSHAMERGSNDYVKSSELTFVTGKEQSNLRLFDFERQNPRTQDSIGDCGGFQVASFFQSHGETNRQLTKGLLETKDIDDAIVVLDEPDQALDFDGVFALFRQLEHCKARQVLVSVHHPLLVLSNFTAIELVAGYRSKMREDLGQFLEV